MNNLETIVTIVGCMVGIIPVWMLIYFGGKIITHFYIRKHLGDMPSAEEIAELYARNNAQIRDPFGRCDQSPTDDKSTK